jgi:hypothetical protein
MKIVIDRFEGNFAVCEYPDGSMKDISVKDLPGGVEVGLVLTFDNGVFSVDETETISRKKRIEDKANRLFE